MDLNREVQAKISPSGDDVTYSIPFRTDQISFSAEEQFVAQLTHEELECLYLELREYKCGLKEPEPAE